MKSIHLPCPRCGADCSYEFWREVHCSDCGHSEYEATWDYRPAIKVSPARMTVIRARREGK